MEGLFTAQEQMATFRVHISRPWALLHW